MRNEREFWVAITSVALAIAIVLIASGPAAAQQEKVIYSFSTFSPSGGVVFDDAGNLYGTQTLWVYKLAPQPGGGWTESVIYSFDDPEDLEGTLARDSSGTLYGVDLGSGCCDDGAIFEMIPSGDSWITNIIYEFPVSGIDGRGPYAGPVLDSAGNLYGTTFYGGRYGDQSHGGVAWELSPVSGFKRLHNFGNGTDGDGPYAGLILDNAGNLYGTTVSWTTQGISTAPPWRVAQKAMALCSSYCLNPTEPGGKRSCTTSLLALTDKGRAPS
jgi:hypothetical protein